MALDVNDARAVVARQRVRRTRTSEPPERFRAIVGRWSGGGQEPLNVLGDEKRLAVLAALVDGNSERATERMTNVCAKTIGRFALACGIGAGHFHNARVRELSCSLVQCDETWSYVKKKQARVTPEDGRDVGEAYTFVGLDAGSRLVISYLVGKRDQETANAFAADLRARLVVMPQITADGFAPYVTAIGASFGFGVDFAQTIKNYRKGGTRPSGDHRYEPPREPFVTKKVVFGAPDMEEASTAYVERFNGTARHKIGRTRRLVYAFSKKLEQHRAAMSLGIAWYNFGTVVKTLRCTPAMQAGLTDRIWTLGEFMEAILTAAPVEPPAKVALTHRTPGAPARELPNGRGFLRLVSGGAAWLAPPAPTPPPASVAAQAGASAHVAPAAPAPAPEPTGQLDLLAWRPKPRPMGQLGLFGEEA
jgi:IS1 family transposase